MLCRCRSRSEVFDMAQSAVALHRHPDYLEPNPLLRERFCPVAVKKIVHKKSVTEVREEIIEA